MLATSRSTTSGHPPTAAAEGLPSSALPMKRMDRKEFFGALAPLDDERLRKALWNLYWRGSAAMRERIEAELDAEAQGHRQRAENRVVDPDSVLREVQVFVAAPHLIRWESRHGWTRTGY